MKVLFSDKMEQVAMSLWCALAMPFVVMIGFFNQKQLGMIGLGCVSALYFIYLIADVLHYNFVKYNCVRRFSGFSVFRNK